MKFEDYQLEHQIKENLIELGFKRPTDIQYRAIKPILDKEDVLAIAQTGTGKTAAFAIPTIELLLRKKLRKSTFGIKAIVMVPTHELAMQITEVFHKIEKKTSIKTFGIYGGVDQDPQIEQLKNGIDIVVATPGRLFDLYKQGHLILKNVEILILDEADQMLALGFKKDIDDLSKIIPSNRQTLFFSATINETIKKLAYSIVKNAIRIQISPKERISKNITHTIAHISMDDKRYFLERIIKQNDGNKILVFVRTRVRAERVYAAMQRVQIETITMHGEKTQEERKNALEVFKNGKIKVFIATDISARGIDIPNVDYVINYDIPDVPENYIHRIGRTGRGMNKGTAISFCSHEEKDFLNQIEEYINLKIPVTNIDRNTYFETIDFTSDTGNNNWKALIQEAESSKKKEPKKPNKKKKS